MVAIPPSELLQLALGSDFGFMTVLWIRKAKMILFGSLQEEKAKAYKKEKQKEKKRRAEEDLTFEEDDEMAAVMGFSGFGSTKKSY